MHVSPLFRLVSREASLQLASSPCARAGTPGYEGTEAAPVLLIAISSRGILCLLSELCGSNSASDPRMIFILEACDEGAATIAAASEDARREVTISHLNATSMACLSKRQREVAALAAAGLSNAEISGQLFIDVSTVKSHLSDVYRCLRIRRRSQLALCLDDQATTAPRSRLRR